MILGKLAPPGAPDGVVTRSRLVERFALGARVLMVVAPPGYGKTEAARQWFDASGRPTAWLTLDLLDDNPGAFWRDLIDALRVVMPGISDEPGLLLRERGPSDTVFLGALIAEIEEAGVAAAVVVDDIARVTDRSVLDGIALIVDRIGHLLRFVIIGRSDPALPSARWRSAGWLGEIREEHLRFTDPEAVAAASTFPDLDLRDDAVIALNTRAEGWPAGLHLALLSLADSTDPDAAARQAAGSDHLLADYLVAEVLDGLPAAERDVALGLSVLDWFDADLCAELLGPDAVPVARALIRRRLFLSVIDGHSGTMRFHHMFRELLEHELRWRDPDGRIELHRRAAELWIARGELTVAHRHLLKIDDHLAACRLVVPLALDFVTRGDLAGLTQRLRALPAALRVDDAPTALDLSMAWFLAGQAAEASSWSERAEQLMSADDPHEQLRFHAYRTFQALMNGHVAQASFHLAGFERFQEHAETGNSIESHFAAVGARVALAEGRLGDARAWVDRARAYLEPDAIALVIAPALEAWLELENGNLGRATALANVACDEAGRLAMRPNHGAIEALLTAGWCRVAAGDLLGAEHLAELATGDADDLGWAWPRARAVVLDAEVRRLRSGPQPALDLIAAARATFAADGLDHLAAWFDAVEAAALIDCGRYDAAHQHVERLDDSPRTRLLRARLALASHAAGSLDRLLEDRVDWAWAEQLEAELLLAAAAPDGLADERLVVALELGHETGWVSPFLGHGRAVQRILGQAPVDALHPALGRALDAARPSAGPTGHPMLDQLTPREITLLELLPTHLTYAQMGERLFLSVNTIKSNLKSLYRKLEVASRAEAVEASAELGLT